MKFVFSYDLATGTPHPNEYFLAAAQLEGMLFVIRAGKNMVRLPHTTLWGVFPNRATATDAFARAVGLTSDAVGYPVTVEKSAVIAAGIVSTTSNRRVPVDPAYAGLSAIDLALRYQQEERTFALPKAVLMSVRLAQLRRQPAKPRQSKP